MGNFVFHIGARRAEVRRRDGPAHRARARAVALFRPAARHAGVPPRARQGRREWRRARRRRANQPAQAQDREGSRQPGLSADRAWQRLHPVSRNEGRDPRPQVPARRQRARLYGAVRDAVARPHAEGPLRPRADHHHRADGAAPVGDHLRVPRAPLGDGDAAAVHRHGAEHRHADRHLQILSRRTRTPRR